MVGKMCDLFVAGFGFKCFFSFFLCNLCEYDRTCGLLCHISGNLRKREREREGKRDYFKFKKQIVLKKKIEYNYKYKTICGCCCFSILGKWMTISIGRLKGHSTHE